MIKTKPRRENGRSASLDAKSRQLQEQSHRLLEGDTPIPSHYRYNVTICNDPAFVWFRNAKVGTRSIFNALTAAGVSLVAESPYNCYYFPRSYQDHFKFCFVRNPWDRFVSGWLNKVMSDNAMGFEPQTYERIKDFNAFVDYWSGEDLESCNAHFRLQSRLVDLNETDFVGRLETFSDDLKTVFGRLGIPLPEVPQSNRSEGRRHYSTYYNDESIEKIASMYSRDIQIFGYHFDNQRDTGR